MACPFLAEFHNLGAQVGGGILPSREFVVLHRGVGTDYDVFAMSTSCMIVALAVILSIVFIVFRVLSQYVWRGVNGSKPRGLALRVSWEPGACYALSGVGCRAARAGGAVTMSCRRSFGNIALPPPGNECLEPTVL